MNRTDESRLFALLRRHGSSLTLGELEKLKSRRSHPDVDWVDFVFEALRATHGDDDEWLKFNVHPHGGVKVDDTPSHVPSATNSNAPPDEMSRIDDADEGDIGRDATLIDRSHHNFSRESRWSVAHTVYSDAFVLMKKLGEGSLESQVTTDHDLKVCLVEFVNWLTDVDHDPHHSVAKDAVRHFARKLFPSNSPEDVVHSLVDAARRVDRKEGDRLPSPSPFMKIKGGGLFESNLPVSEPESDVLTGQPPPADVEEKIVTNEPDQENPDNLGDRTNQGKPVWQGLEQAPSTELPVVGNDTTPVVPPPPPSTSSTTSAAFPFIATPSKINPFLKKLPNTSSVFPHLASLSFKASAFTKRYFGKSCSGIIPRTLKRRKGMLGDFIHRLAAPVKVSSTRSRKRWGRCMAGGRLSYHADKTMPFNVKSFFNAHLKNDANLETSSAVGIGDGDNRRYYSVFPLHSVRPSVARSFSLDRHHALGLVSHHDTRNILHSFADGEPITHASLARRTGRYHRFRGEDLNAFHRPANKSVKGGAIESIEKDETPAKDVEDGVTKTLTPLDFSRDKLDVALADWRSKSHIRRRLEHFLEDVVDLPSAYDRHVDPHVRQGLSDGVDYAVSSITPVHVEMLQRGATQYAQHVLDAAHIPHSTMLAEGAVKKGFAMLPSRHEVATTLKRKTDGYADSIGDHLRDFYRTTSRPFDSYLPLHPEMTGNEIMLAHNLAKERVEMGNPDGEERWESYRQLYNIVGRHLRKRVDPSLRDLYSDHAKDDPKINEYFRYFWPRAYEGTPLSIDQRAQQSWEGRPLAPSNDVEHPHPVDIRGEERVRNVTLSTLPWWEIVRPTETSRYGLADDDEEHPVKQSYEHFAEVTPVEAPEQQPSTPSKEIDHSHLARFNAELSPDVTESELESRANHSVSRAPVVSHASSHFGRSFLPVVHSGKHDVASRSRVQRWFDLLPFSQMSRVMRFSTPRHSLKSFDAIHGKRSFSLRYKFHALKNLQRFHDQRAKYSRKFVASAARPPTTLLKAWKRLVYSSSSTHVMPSFRFRHSIDVATAGKRRSSYDKIGESYRRLTNTHHPTVLDVFARRTLAD